MPRLAAWHDEPAPGAAAHVVAAAYVAATAHVVAAARVTTAGFVTTGFVTANVRSADVFAAGNGHADDPHDDPDDDPDYDADYDPGHDEHTARVYAASYAAAGRDTTDRGHTGRPARRR